jgi:cell division GTPase FtsZ
MEPEKNAVVFGVGGAGCKALNLISKDCPNNTELIAVDIDPQQLNSLDESIKSIQIGQSIDDSSDMDSAKAVILSDLGDLETLIDGAKIVIIIAGLGRKTGTYVSCKIAEKAVDLGRMCITIPIYPFQTKRARTQEANNAIARLKEVANGVIIADNNSKRTSKDMPVIDVFREVNFQVSRLVCSLVSSVNGLCDMSVTADELRSFFYGSQTCVIGAGEGDDLKSASQEAIKEIGRYVEEDSVKNLMVLVKSPYELELNYVRNLAEELEGRYEPEELKWIAEGSGNGNYHVLIIAAVTELPLIDSLQMPEHIETTSEETRGETLGDVVEEEASTRQALIGLHFMEEDTGEGLPSSEDDGLPGLVDTNEKATKDMQEEDVLPGLPVWNVEEPSERVDEVGVEESVNRADSIEQDLDDVLEEMAAELTGFPIQKRKGQKKLEEYDDDDLGIDFI